jgi:nanoRNase/pAp phosphatase (c-di-AMP/oligoRNAs hydrolase)
MKRSGAGLAWDFCFPGQPRPLMIDLVEDRDLWTFRLSHTREFHLWLSLRDLDFDAWDHIELSMSSGSLDHVLAQAEAIGRYHNVIVERLVATVRFTACGLFTPDVPIVNCPGQFASDVGHALLKAYPDAPYSATYYDASVNFTRFSLRSEDGRADVSEIARSQGGGGHRNAAGFQTEWGVWP